MMKKMIALLLALAAMAAFGLAHAETLNVVPGTPLNSSVDEFIAYFDLMSSASGYEFTWDEQATTEDQYTVRTAVSSDGSMSLKAYALDGNICYAVAEGSSQFDPNDYEAGQKFGEWFGASIGGITLGFYICENGTAGLSEKMNDVLAQFQSDLTPLTEFLSGGLSEEAVADGKVTTTTILGYPTGMEVAAAMSGEQVQMSLKIAVTGKDGQLSGQ